MGAGRFLRSMNPSVKIHPLEPSESPTLTTGCKVGKHRIQGISDEFIPDILDLSALDEVIREQGPGKNSAIFTSGGTIATIVAHVLGAGAGATYQFYEPVINCSITQLLYNANKVSLSYYNDHSFLDLLGRQNGESLITYR